ncbi:MAG: hypothetical protein GXP01_11200 [Alphaproteobacteria bacterium]|nr:hypothetical protein [Alphaproteobacteria bacterium]
MTFVFPTTTIRAWHSFFGFAANVKSLPRVGGMATMRSRRGCVEQALATIMPQIDRLHLYLDDYDEVPRFARHERIIAYLGDPAQRLGCAGKFLALQNEPEPVLFAGFDDDILYAANHVDRLRECLIRHRGDVLAGVHGADFKAPYASFVRDRKSYNFPRRLKKEVSADILGCGTIAFLTDRFRLDPSAFSAPGIDDILVATLAQRAGMGRIAIKRRTRWMKPIHLVQDDSIWAGVLRDERQATLYMRRLMVEMGRLPASQLAPEADGCGH